MRGKLIIFSAPSGTGKSTIISWLMKEHKELNLAFSISCTSRAPRGTEQNGVEYFFLTPEEFRTRIEDDEFLEYDKNRLEQELIYYIEKLDISEEKQRLNNHLKYFRDTMNEPAGQGKKLGFIAQEMGREINTTGSKSNQAEMQNIVVKMKDELEQIKEQVLNAL